MTARAAPRAMVLGCAGTVLDDAERCFMADADPAGFILFKRNCENPVQTQALIDSLREAVDRPDAPVLIDQEGGRVIRLGPPHWRPPPAPGLFGALAEIDESTGARAAWLNARLVAADLHSLGFTVNCVPVLDLRSPVRARSSATGRSAQTRSWWRGSGGRSQTGCAPVGSFPPSSTCPVTAERPPTATRCCRTWTRRSRPCAPAISCRFARSATRPRA